MPAKFLGDLRPLVHRIRLGGFEVTTILDGAQTRDGISPPFGIDQTPEAMAQLAAENRLPDTWFENTFTPTVVNTGAQLVLFDTGNGAPRRDSGAGYLRERLGLAGYRPEDVDVVAFTHMHPDHIGGLWEGDTLAYPNARYVIARREYDVWSKGDEIPERRNENRKLFLKLIPPIADRTTFIEPGDDVAPGIRGVNAFGHSLGHMAYQVESEGHSLLIWGDTTNHFVLSLQNPGWQAAMDDDRDLAVETRKRILDMVATDRMLAIGHHMPFPAIGYVERHENAYRWVPTTYQMRS